MKSPFGFVIIDKPKGLTSHDCVKRLRRIYGLKRVGHGGTLDPEVTGVLPIAIGSATRLLPYLPGDKVYEGVVQLGTITNTDDLQGEIIDIKSIPKITLSFLEEHLKSFKGKIEQRPPQFSSVHFQGVRAYKLAREGKVMNLAAKEITIFELQIMNWDQLLGQIKIYVHCSAGTYIRSLARDIGEILGCGGCLAKLRRLQALGFNEKQAVNLPNAKDYLIKDLPKVIDPLQALRHLSHLELTKEELFLWRYGRILEISPNRYISPLNNQKQNSSVVVIDSSGDIAGIASRDSHKTLKPKVVFNANG